MVLRLSKLVSLPASEFRVPLSGKAYDMTPSKKHVCHTLRRAKVQKHTVGLNNVSSYLYIPIRYSVGWIKIIESMQTPDKGPRC